METGSCEECGFDARRWTDGDLSTSLPIAGALLDEYLAGLGDHRIGAPGPDGSSIADRAAALRRAAAGRVLPEGPLTPAEREGALRVAHALQHDLGVIGRLRASVDPPPAGRGRVVALHRSGGGVPKRPVSAVEVTSGGVEGDAQHDRRNHGRPFQALCLWGSEVIDALRAEGHPVAPGLAGENVTISGIPWSGLRPGARVQLGSVLAEISSYATPCAKNAPWFLHGDHRRMDQDRHPGWSRLYAWVRRPGRIAVDDAVVVEPDS